MKNLEDILKKDHYKNILKLLDLFEFQTYSIKENEKTWKIIEDIGLRPAHFRFALMDDPKFNNPDMYKRIKQFFNKKSCMCNSDIVEKLEDCYYIGYLTKGSIETPQKLSNYLNKLIDMNYIEKCSKKGKIYYRLTQKYYIESKKLDIINDLKNWKYSETSISWEDHLYYDHENEIDSDLEKVLDIGVLFGISYDLLQNKSDRKMIFDCLKNIYENLSIIVKFKFGKIFPNVNLKNLNKKEYSNLLMNDLLLDDSKGYISFYGTKPLLYYLFEETQGGKNTK